MASLTTTPKRIMISLLVHSGKSHVNTIALFIVDYVIGKGNALSDWLAGYAITLNKHLSEIIMSNTDVNKRMAF